MNKKNIKIQEGQLWRFNDESTLSEVRIIIGKIEIMMSTNHNAHVSVKNIKLDNEYFDIDHLPINLDLLLNSLEKMILIDSNLNYNNKSLFLEGYKYWKEAKGGVWNVSLKEAINQTIKQFPARV